MIEEPENEPKRMEGKADSAGLQVEAPVITLPKGCGAIRGMGEKFAANSVTGTGAIGVPIATNWGPSGFGPELSLSYDLGAGNGLVGFSWSLWTPSIMRKTDKGLPRYRDDAESDMFLLSRVDNLVPIYGQYVHRTWVCNALDTLVIPEDPIEDYYVRRYGPRIKGLFAHLEQRKRESDGYMHWRSITKA
jgi:hypothetical protein